LAYILAPCAILAVVFNYEMSPLELLWTFSIYLEAVAILPQLFMVQRTGEAESITSHYLFALGSYRCAFSHAAFVLTRLLTCRALDRGLYIANWIYRYWTEGHFDVIAVVAGIIQTILYADFFYLYITRGMHVCV
jgi:ER lumen protein retaining receptor